MKVILLQDVPKLGKKYEVKNVKNGYGRNFLLPRKLAEMAVKASLKSLDARKAVYESKKIKAEKELAEVVQKLKEKEILIGVKANEQGELFGSVSSEIISDEFKKQGLGIPKEYINLDEHIKHVGEYEIEIKVGDNIGKIKLKIVSE